jgi:hypothetical protein
MNLTNNEIILSPVQAAAVLPVVTFCSTLFCYYTCAALVKGVIVIVLISESHLPFSILRICSFLTAQL